MTLQKGTRDRLIFGVISTVIGLIIGVIHALFTLAFLYDDWGSGSRSVLYELIRVLWMFPFSAQRNYLPLLMSPTWGVIIGVAIYFSLNEWRLNRLSDEAQAQNRDDQL